MKVFLLLFFITSCASAPKKAEVKTAWLGKDLTILERHKYFSTLNSTKKTISDSEVLVNIQEHRFRATGGRTCFGTGVGWGYYSRFGINTSTCSPQEYTQDDCVHQFTLIKNKITNYSLVGKNCSLECRHLPSGKCKK